MTTYNDDNKEVDYDSDEWKEVLRQRREGSTSKEMLLQQLEAHLVDISHHNLDREKYAHKYNVLRKAIVILESDEQDLTELQDVIQRNPRYNEAKRKESVVKELIDKTINFINDKKELDALKSNKKEQVIEQTIEISPQQQMVNELRIRLGEESKSEKPVIDIKEQKKETPTLSLVQIELVGELQKQLNKVRGKRGDKHTHKAAVLASAIETIKGEKTLDELSAVIQQNPRYAESTIIKSKTERLINNVIDIAQNRLDAKPPR